MSSSYYTQHIIIIKIREKIYKHYVLAVGRQRWSFCGRGLLVKDQSLSAAGRGQLGHRLCHGQEAWSLHPSVTLPALDLHCHEGRC